jgi:hypothetical protein
MIARHGTKAQSDGVLRNAGSAAPSA